MLAQQARLGGRRAVQGHREEVRGLGVTGPKRSAHRGAMLPNRKAGRCASSAARTAVGSTGTAKISGAVARCVKGVGMRQV